MIDYFERIVYEEALYLYSFKGKRFILLPESINQQPVVPPLCLPACLIVIGIIGYRKLAVLTSEMYFLILYGIAAGFILYRMIRELANLHQVSTLRKSSLLPFIHTAKEDDTFYSEELSGGFIIQTEAN